MDRQQVSNQKGEIEFRKKLVSQQVKGEHIFDDEHDSASGENILRERMNVTLTRMTQMKDAGIPLSPYLELGAERCQRSLVMENEIEARGAGADISFDMLQSCDHYKEVFKKPNVPARLCCDANNLPLKSDSIPFVFCYEFLHHFPDPSPIIAEISRVLRPGGCFFFDDEPYKQVLHWDLYEGNKQYSREKLDRGVVRKFFDHFFATSHCNEVLHGVIENDDISIAQWKNALNIFEAKDVRIRPMARSSFGSDLFHPTSFLKYLAAYLLGGTISGLCKKEPEKTSELVSIYGALICPSCKRAGTEEPLNRTSSLFICSNCSKKYPVVDGVAFLFEYGKFVDLYPDVFRSIDEVNTVS